MMFQDMPTRSATYARARARTIHIRTHVTHARPRLRHTNARSDLKRHVEESISLTMVSIDLNSLILLLKSFKTYVTQLIS